MDNYKDLLRAPLWRRLLAMVYDGLIVIGVLMIVTMIYHSVVNVWWLGLSKAPEGYNPILASVLFISIFLFFSIFWRKSGQTLGMQAWGLRVQNYDGKMLSWSQCLLRFIIAILGLGLAGLGFWWMLLTSQKQTWHDSYSESEIVMLPKLPKESAP